MKASVDADLCIGCELCQDGCPDVFEVGDDGISHVLLEEIGPEFEDCVREAVEVCPTEAISLKED